MPYSVNGIGTTYYGSADPWADGSSVVTEWIIFLGVPLLPLGSKRVWYQFQERRWGLNQNVTHYKVARVPLHLPHLAKGYAVTGGIWLLGVALDSLHK